MRSVYCVRIRSTGCTSEVTTDSLPKQSTRGPVSVTRDLYPSVTLITNHQYCIITAVVLIRRDKRFVLMDRTRLRKLAIKNIAKLTELRSVISSYVPEMRDRKNTVWYVSELLRNRLAIFFNGSSSPLRAQASYSVP
jgi:hypothetical protein